MMVKSAEFVTSALKPGQYPPAQHPEIAFAGRSNVGKSSLINTLLNRRRLVKTSSTPGRTQMINFFIVNSALMMVDLPGYGYAKVPQAVRKQWGPMVETYLSQRANLKALVLLMDVRRSAGAEELNFMQWLQHFNIAALPVLTKADKLSKNEQRKQRKSIAGELSLPEEALILFSAKSGQGKELLWQCIETILEGNHATPSAGAAE